MRIPDYKCFGDNSGDHIREAIKRMGLSIPECYQKKEDMMTLAKGIRDLKGQKMVILPFCHTVEGEALGARINFGDFVAGPRCGGYTVDRIEDVPILPPIDLTKGRIHETLMAVKELSEAGETVLLEISGPFTVLNTLMDSTVIFKSIRKNQEAFTGALKRLEKDLLEFLQAAVDNGARIISYADSAGSVGIIGPKVSQYMADNFTVDFLKKAGKIVEGRATIHLCPKTTYLLTGIEAAGFRELPVNAEDTYEDVIIRNTGKAVLMGDRCLNHLDMKIGKGRVRELVFNS